MRHLNMIFQAGIVLLTARVFDMLGREVSVVISEELPAGNYSRQWNAVILPSGVYFYRLEANALPSGEAGSFISTKKLILLKQLAVIKDAFV